MKNKYLKKRWEVLTILILTSVLAVASAALIVGIKSYKEKQTAFEDTIPVERIEITNEGLSHNDTWGDYIVIDKPDENGKISYKINHRVYPENATNKKVNFSYQASPEGCATVDEHGAVSFSSAGMIKVFAITTDGGDAQDTITIISTVDPKN